MATTKSKTKSEASKEMRDPKASKQEKSAAAKEMSSGSKKKSSK
ncbi:hypothetical protein [Mucilaginibacter sp. KACC 22063]|nr:hypothetical protein [Mucilaginibacter sp. KACC 22063]WDF54049.1 hypothetical protein PQ461_13970 [Mucilaginibacter sp. KACC 22063]